MALDADASLADEVPAHHGGGRPLDASRDDVLRAAALELLADIGYDRLTIDKIAARAGAGKATIYRRWSGKAELIVDALMCEKVMLPVPDTGTLRGDLAALVDQADVSTGQLDTQVIIGLVSALPHDAELRDVFRTQLVDAHVATLALVFRRAVTRGEIPPVENLEMIVSLLPALVLHRLIVTATGPDRAFFESVIEGVLLPLLKADAVDTSTTVPKRKGNDDVFRGN
jgi:AcrR family transcriptional regulator